MKSAVEHTQKPLSTVSLFASLLQLADVIVDDVPDDEGFFSARFQPRPRQVLRGWVPVDADAVIPQARRSEALVGDVRLRRRAIDDPDRDD
jgi:hypothetical protein